MWRISASLLNISSNRSHPSIKAGAWKAQILLLRSIVAEKGAGENIARSFLQMANSSAAVGRWRVSGTLQSFTASNTCGYRTAAMEIGMHLKAVQPVTESGEAETKPIAPSNCTEKGRMAQQVQLLKAALQNKRSELARLIRAQSSQLSVDEGEHELVDRMQSMSRRDEAVTFLDKMTRTLASVDAALLAMQEGSYGTCAECGEPIATRRLQAIPWASHCIRCQERLDDGNHMRAATPRWDEAA